MKKMKDKENKKPFIIGTIIILVLWLASYWIISKIFLDNNSDIGTFGDSFGAINALFSGMALAGIIYTILLQRKELSYQREELRETRKEFQIQNQTLKRQRFENTFFHMLTLHNEIVDKLSFEIDDVIFEKRNYFKGAYSELAGQNNADLTAKYLDNEATRNAINDGYRYFFFEHHSSLGHYFRNLYHIFKYVHLSNLIEETDKPFYASIVRAQLSSFELNMMFYNSLIDGLGYPKFKFLIDEYDLIQNLDENNLLNESHLAFYYTLNPENPFKVPNKSRL